jgi:eukaryotic-like serine/threonine-protein kinase
MEFEEDFLIGKEIGVYRLEMLIGRSGIGAVYLAERVDGVFRRRAAVKLIERRMDTDVILRRFR